LNPSTAYSTKAEKYAKYRWDYAPQAIQTIFDITGISAEAAIADVGAGTGILTRHFVNRVKQVFAIEPNPAMREIAMKVLGHYPSFQAIDGTAEATTLADGSVDLITVAQAIHWFQPELARAEFLRILKPGGWLAILRNYSTGNEIIAAMATVLTAENGVDTAYEAKLPERKPLSFYYGHEQFRQYDFPFTLQESWEGFAGSWVSAASMPDEDHPLYPQFEQGMREVFDRFSEGGVLAVHGVTELVLGQIL
jgi:ubiquinone/menaquinone biosynthesis C-methylase UbiE